MFWDFAQFLMIDSEHRAESRSSSLNDRGEIFSVSVKNLFGKEMPIVDFYTAMGEPYYDCATDLCT